ncbi:uncharacterized protein LOC144781485 isoform X1 [Lissotriton helveticus]
MFCQDQDGVHAIFPDASAYFSEEEWKPLHKWQKDLYRNVMMEIHKALISLGPLIATTMFSLRSQEIEELISVDHQDSEKRHSMRYSQNDVISNPEVSFRVNRRKQQYPKTSQDIERREKNDSLNTGMSLFRQDSCLKKEEPISILIDDLGEEARDSNSDHNKEQEVISFRIKGEKDTHCMDQHDSKRKEIFSSDTEGEIPNSDLLFRVNRQQKEQYLKTPQHTEEREKNHCLNTGITFFNADICLMKEEEPVSILIEDLVNEVGEGSTDHNTGDGPTTTKWKAEEMMKCIEKMPAHKNVPVKTKVNVLQRSIMGTHSRSLMWSENTNQEQGGKKKIHHETAFLNAVHSNLHKDNDKAEESDTDNICDDQFSLVSFSQNAPQHLRQFITMESEQNFSFIEGFYDNQKTATLERPYHCTECDKSFSRKQHFIGHQRIHTGERPYQCTVCEKSFSHMHHLARHQRIHAGEKPYECTECGKRFSRKDSLLGHQRVHKGRTLSWHALTLE